MFFIFIWYYRPDSQSEKNKTKWSSHFENEESNSSLFYVRRVSIKHCTQLFVISHEDYITPGREEYTQTTLRKTTETTKIENMNKFSS